jgi:hypothetical protein
VLAHVSPRSDDKLNGRGAETFVEHDHLLTLDPDQKREESAFAPCRPGTAVSRAACLRRYQGRFRYPSFGALSNATGTSPPMAGRMAAVRTKTSTFASVGQMARLLGPELPCRSGGGADGGLASRGRPEGGAGVRRRGGPDRDRTGLLSRHRETHCLDGLHAVMPSDRSTTPSKMRGTATPRRSSGPCSAPLPRRPDSATATSNRRRSSGPNDESVSRPSVGRQRRCQWQQYWQQRERTRPNPGERPRTIKRR